MNKLEFGSKYYGLLSYKNAEDTDLTSPMRLKNVNFNAIQVKGLSIMENNKDIASGFIGEVLEYLAKEKPEYAEKEIKSVNYFFDMFVIRL